MVFQCDVFVVCGECCQDVVEFFVIDVEVGLVWCQVDVYVWVVCLGGGFVEMCEWWCCCYGCCLGMFE